MCLHIPVSLTLSLFHPLCVCVCFGKWFNILVLHLQQIWIISGKIVWFLCKHPHAYIRNFSTHKVSSRILSCGLNWNRRSKVRQVDKKNENTQQIDLLIECVEFSGIRKCLRVCVCVCVLIPRVSGRCARPRFYIVLVTKTTTTTTTNQINWCEIIILTEKSWPDETYIKMNVGGAYGGGKAGASFDLMTFVQRPQVILRGCCWVSVLYFNPKSKYVDTHLVSCT